MTNPDRTPLPAPLPPPRLDDAVIARRRPLPWCTIGLVASAALAVAAFLPWMTVRAAFIGQVSVSGMEGDGLEAIAFALVTAFAFARRHHVLAVTLAAISVGGVLVEMALFFNRTRHAEADFDGMGTASIGIGLWLALLSTLVGLVAAVQLLRAAER